MVGEGPAEGTAVATGGSVRRKKAEGWMRWPQAGGFGSAAYFCNST